MKLHDLRRLEFIKSIKKGYDRCFRLLSLSIIFIFILWIVFMITENHVFVITIAIVSLIEMIFGCGLIIGYDQLLNEENRLRGKNERGK